MSDFSDESNAPIPGADHLRSVQLRYADSVPPLYQNRYLEAVQGKCPRSGAIKAKCQECVGYENVANRVRFCEVYTCPLWHYRPYQQKAER